MRKLKEIMLRMLPTLVVLAITALLSLVIYNAMIERETEACWDGLRMATSDVAHEMTLRFDDNFSMLDLAADAIVLQADLKNVALGISKEHENRITDYLEKVQEGTIFSRIDVIFPAGTLSDGNNILLQDGTHTSDKDKLTFEELFKKGAHLSTRRTDPESHNEVIYYFTPVLDDDVAKAMLIGVLDCNELSGIFESSHYSGSAQIFLVDRRNGDFLIDNWHDTLGNLYDDKIKNQDMLEDYKDIAYTAGIMKGENVEIAFYAKSNGMASYMEYMPIENYEFSAALFIQEDVAFKDVATLREMLFLAGIIEAVILLVYFIWNAYWVIAAVKSRAKARQAEIDKEKNRAKTQFLSSVSHDIRTPLNGIIGMLDVIKLKGNVPVHMEDSLKKIDISAKYLLTLANDVLDLNEIESGKLILEHSAIDLEQLANELKIIMQPRADEKHISYSVDVSGISKPNVLGSAVHITKILTNLIGNAIKYNKDGGSVQVTFSDDSVGNYTFVVKDTGIGMSEAFQKNMYAAFEQESAGARTQRIGHGLGLSIVKNLVDRMNGSVACQSTKNVGTTITVTLPLEIDENVKEIDNSDSEDITLQNLKLLLAEDNELNMEIAHVMLSEAGASVVCAKDGKEALEIFKNSSPFSFDAILMDLMMPVMDGHESTKSIRSLDRPDAKKIPIVAMTASTFSEELKKCKDSGMNEHIPKPIDMSSAVSKISRLINNYKKQI